MGVAVERMPSAQLKAGVQRCEEEGDVRKSFLTLFQLCRDNFYHRVNFTNYGQIGCVSYPDSPDFETFLDYRRTGSHNR